MVTLSQKGFLAPGASLWITCWEDSSLWAQRLDGLLNYIPKKYEEYNLNTHIELFKNNLSEENFNTYFYKKTSPSESSPLIVIPHNRLPTSYVIFLHSWKNILQINPLNMKLQQPTLRFFGSPPEHLLTQSFTNDFNIEIVES